MVVYPQGGMVVVGRVKAGLHPLPNRVTEFFGVSRGICRRGRNGRNGWTDLAAKGVCPVVRGRFDGSAYAFRRPADQVTT
jgi:hypothetical protein